MVGNVVFALFLLPAYEISPEHLGSFDYVYVSIFAGVLQLRFLAVSSLHVSNTDMSSTTEFGVVNYFGFSPG